MTLDSPHGQRARRFLDVSVRAYRAVALALLTACFLFLLLNVVLLGFLWFAERSGKSGSAARVQRGPGAEILSKVYPHYDPQVVAQVWRECMAPLVYEPFLEFRERPRAGRWVNVIEPGFRAIEDQGPWPPDPANLNIFVFGGSTTFGYGVADQDTWPSHLQAVLRAHGEHARLYNFGQGYYYSSQERLFLERILMSGHVPHMAIFMDGLNDFCFVEDNTKASGKLARALEQERGQDPPSPGFLERLPLGRTIEWFRSRGPSAELTTPAPDYQDAAVLQHIIRRYWENKKAIEAVCRAYGVVPVFVWQPVPSYKLDLRLHPFADGGFMTHSRSVYGYPAMAEWIRANPPSRDFVWLADIQEGATKPLYVDLVHYSPGFHAELAVELDTRLRDLGLYDEVRR
jgi:lysophospholipase L1-like esterase